MKKVTKPGGLCVSGSVRLAETQDGAALLDVRQGLCFGMTPVGTKIWHLLKQRCSVDQIVDCLCTDYKSIPRERIADDVTEFVRALKDKRLLGMDHRAPTSGLFTWLLAFVERHRLVGKSPPVRTKTPRFLFLRALLGLAAFDLFRFGTNFCCAYEFVRGWKVPGSQSSGDVVNEVCQAMNYACVWYPKRILCLQRSAVLTVLLRSYGVPARMVLGAQKLPFKAHAWVEVDGRVINESPDVQTIYMLWDQC